MTLLQQGSPVWVRDESLGAVVSTLFLDLPADSRDASAMQAQPATRLSFTSFLHYQLLHFKVSGGRGGAWCRARGV